MMVLGTPRLAFVYGSREVLWSPITKSLFAEKGAVGDTLMRCEQLIQQRLGWSLREVFAIQRFDNEQVRDPSLAALQIALTQGWRERGVEPDVIAARSGGEYAAEFARGAITLEDAIEVACRISRFVRDRRGTGRLLAVRLGLADIQCLQQSSPVRFYVVADADDDTTIVACETAAVEPLGRLFVKHRIGYGVIHSAFAPHSPLIDEWKCDLLKPLSGTAPASALIRYYSAAVNGPDDTESYSVRLWRAVREPAFAGRMLDNLIAEGFNIFLEVGGQPKIAHRIQRRAAAAGKEVLTLPAAQSGSARALMDQTQETLQRAGITARPRRAAEGAPIRFSVNEVALFSPQVRHAP